MRKVQEWIGANDNTAIPGRVKLRIFKLYDGHCAVCSLHIAGKLRPEYDHIVALCNGETGNRESNLRLLCVPCHKVKIKADVAEKSKVNRVRKKHLGIRKPRSIRAWRKFNGEKVFAPRER